jgi:hypothetical protein
VQLKGELAALCRIKLDLSQQRASDKYNGSLLQSPNESSKSAQSSGYSLGSSLFGQFSQFGGLNGVESRCGQDTAYTVMKPMKTLLQTHSI